MFELVGCNGTSIVLEMSGFRQGIPQSYERRPDCSNDNFDRLASEPQLTLIGGNDTRSKISMIVLGRDPALKLLRSVLTPYQTKDSIIRQQRGKYWSREIKRESGGRSQLDEARCSETVEQLTLPYMPQTYRLRQPNSYK